ncbi:DUF3626 domain-containing protein [Actinospica durhamensis]|uniref:DUF3626 domain-containing protein n=1 Tax=Actinospica durhamensis TaxID=1508375 RepID=A0A941ELI6_9ACTN|nr:DUF3626 domain-containing protein [Actinospica durhamensis]MBR7833346.1 DUF3626 domain-containing protein [Actinospica durhamensis]
MPTTPYQRAIAFVEARSEGTAIDPAVRVTLNFHPDRAARGIPILAALAADGVYRSQFATGTSNGGLTAFPGGDRWRWESRIFGGVYDEADPAHRPVYGGLNFRAKPYGAGPRFGSAHFRLTAEAAARATFCYPDSAAEPEHFGTAARMSLIERAAADTGRDALDDYIEAHVHGPVRLERDVEAIVLDPCYAGTEVQALAEALPCPVEWHGGFRLEVAELQRHPDFRGPEIVALGRHIAVDSVLDPAIIGAAVATGQYDPQALKRIWHHVGRFGAAADPASPAVPSPRTPGAPAAASPAPRRSPARPRAPYAHG